MGDGPQQNREIRITYGFFAFASQSVLVLSHAFTHRLKAFSACRRSTPRRSDCDWVIAHDSVQLLCLSAQGSAGAAANIIITPPLTRSAAIEICFFTLEILHSPPEFVENKVRAESDSELIGLQNLSDKIEALS